MNSAGGLNGEQLRSSMEKDTIDGKGVEVVAREVDEKEE